MEFKKAHVDDLEMLCTISVQTFRDAFYDLNNPVDITQYMERAFSPMQLKYELELSQSEFVFLLHRNEPIAYYKTNLSPKQTDINDPDSIEIERIYVCKEHQNKQYGLLMLNHICNQALQNPTIRYIWLGVWDQNKSAIRFYERFGFKLFSSHPFLMGTDPQTDLLMRYNL
ncbi:MAG: GNAT family N-acetyltransferase [Saprospiraceae bacterium]|nr:GNAT family N-acetyltransferase [Saprospiraceae bacterium]